MATMPAGSSPLPGSSSSSRSGSVSSARRDAQALLHAQRVASRPCRRPGRAGRRARAPPRPGRSDVGAPDAASARRLSRPTGRGRRTASRSWRRRRTAACGRATTERPAEHLDRAGVRVGEPGQQPHGRRLARAVGAQEAVDRRRGDGQVQAVERGPRAVALDQAARRDGHLAPASPRSPLARRVTRAARSRCDPRP